jgi:hypothetical protein
MYMTLEWMGLLATSQVHFVFLREVSQELDFRFQLNEGGRVVTSVGV